MTKAKPTELEHQVKGYPSGDRIRASPNDDLLKQLQGTLIKKFEMAHLGEGSWILGMHVLRNETLDTISPSQEHHAANILERFRMVELQPGVNHWDQNGAVGTTGRHCWILPLQGATKLLWSRLCISHRCTRYDIAFTANQLSRPMAKPAQAHMTAAKHLLRSLAGLSINYRAETSHYTASATHHGLGTQTRGDRRPATLLCWLRGRSVPAPRHSG